MHDEFEATLGNLLQGDIIIGETKGGGVKRENKDEERGRQRGEQGGRSSTDWGCSTEEWP